MRKAFILVVIMGMVLAVSIQAHADLNLLGQGTSTHGTYNLIYDTDLDVTWYDYSSFEPWETQLDWAANLSVTFGSNTYTEWRLPTALNQDGSDPCIGYNCTDSEMGHLFYIELGNEGFVDTYGHKTGCGNDWYPPCLTNTGNFQNFQVVDYFSSTESSEESAIIFGLSGGSQNAHPKANSYGAIAVMDGMTVTAVAPEPISTTLFIVGGTLLGYRQVKKRRGLK